MTCLDQRSIIPLWFINVVTLSLVLAIFEILIEKDKGWASAFSPTGWGKILLRGSVVARACDKPYLTTYHIFMFTVVVPLILLGEYVFSSWFAVGHPVYGSGLNLPGRHLVMQTGSARMAAILFFSATWFSILAVEDFLWFTLNWYYPKSFQELLSGKIWWHTHWVSVGPVKLPRSYVSAQVTAGLLLMASICLAK